MERYASPEQNQTTAQIVNEVEYIRGEYERAVQAAEAAARQHLGTIPETVSEGVIGMTPEELGGASQSLFTHYNDFNTIKMRQEHYPRGTSFSTMAPGAMTVRPAEGERINDLIHAAHLQACATGCSYMVAAGSKRITVTPEQSIEQLHEAWENV